MSLFSDPNPTSARNAHGSADQRLVPSLKPTQVQGYSTVCSCTEFDNKDRAKLLLLAHEQPDLFNLIVSIQQYRAIPDSVFRGLFVVASNTNDIGKLQRLIETIHEMSQNPALQPILDDAICTVASAALAYWNDDRPDYFRRFVDLLMAVAQSGRLDQGISFKPVDLGLARSILEEVTVDPVEEFVRVKLCSELPDFQTEESLRRYYAEHRFVVVFGEKSEVTFVCEDLHSKKEISLKSLARALASRCSTLSADDSNDILECLCDATVAQDIKYYLSMVLLSASLKDTDMHLFYGLMQGLDDRLDDVKVPAVCSFLRELGSKDVSAQVKVYGLYVLEDALSATGTLEAICAYRAGDALPRLSSTAGRRLPHTPRSTRDRAISEIVAELRSSGACATAAIGEGLVLRVAHIVKQVLADKVEPSLTPFRLSTDAKGSDQVRLTDQVYIAYCKWARNWFAAYFGFAPNTAQLFSLVLATKQMQEASSERGAWVELATGEGKSSVLALMAGLQILQGKNAVVIAPNNSLVERDWRSFAPFYGALRTASFSLSALSYKGYRLAPSNFVLYATMRDLIFEKIGSISEKRPFLLNASLDTILVDEVDTLLVDHGTQQHWLSKTPSTLTEGDVRFPKRYWHRLFQLAPQFGDSISSAAAYLALVEPSVFGETDPILLSLHASSALELRARRLGVDCLRIDDRLIVVDRTETQRMLPNTVWIHGLHQLVAISRKLPIRPQTKILGQCTPLELVRTFRQIFGCSGTIGNISEQAELQQVYGLHGYQIPTNNASIRVDDPLVVYRTKRELLEAVQGRLLEVHKTRRPILLVTDSILAALNMRRLVAPLPYQFLTDYINRGSSGKIESEDELIQRAGRAGMITITTTMLGRGTDIKLDDEALEAGGLFVLVCGVPALQRGEAQIRRRAARQGQPGGSAVFTSIESDPFIAGLPPDVYRVMANEVNAPAYLPGSDRFLKLFEFARSADTLLRSTRRQLYVECRQGIAAGIEKYLAATYSKRADWFDELTMFPSEVARLLLSQQPEQKASPYMRGSEQHEELCRVYQEHFGVPPPVFADTPTDDASAATLFQCYSSLLSSLRNQRSLLSSDAIYEQLLAYRAAFKKEVANQLALKSRQWWES